MEGHRVAGLGFFLTLTLCCLSCNSSKTPTNTSSAVSSVPIKEYVPKDEDGHNLTPPETVHSEQVQNDNHGVKTLTMGNDKGEYFLACDVKESTCLTPDPGRDYYVFTKTSKWKFPGATGYVTLEWLQSWTGTYNSEENIALAPVDNNRTPEQIGMYWLKSWNRK